MVITTKTLLPTPAVQLVVDPQGPSMGYRGVPACLKCGFVIARNLLFWNTRLCLEILDSLVFFNSCESFLSVLKGSDLLCFFMEMLPWHRRGAMWVVLLVTFCDEGKSCKWVVCICRCPADLRCSDAVVWEAGVPAATALPPPDKTEASVAGWWGWLLIVNTTCEMVPGELCLPFQRCS